MIVAVCSLSGAPGVTTLAAAMTAVWPASPTYAPVMVEADAAGGDLAAWHGVEVVQGLVPLAAASRRYPLVPALESDEEEGWVNPVLGFAQELPGGLLAVPAPSGPVQAQRAVAMVGEHIGLLAAAPVVVVDVGRAVPGSAGAQLLAQAHVVVVVLDGQAAQVGRMRACHALFARLAGRGTRVGLALAGECAFSAAEIEAACGVGVWAQVPTDPVGAGLVRGQDVRLRGALARARAWVHRRRDPDSLSWAPLMREARKLADVLDDLRGIGALGAAGAEAVAA